MSLIEKNKSLLAELEAQVASGHPPKSRVIAGQNPLITAAGDDEARERLIKRLKVRIANASQGKSCRQIRAAERLLDVRVK